MRAAPRSLQQVAYYARRDLSTLHNRHNAGLQYERCHGWRQVPVRGSASATAVVEKELDKDGFVDAMLERYPDLGDDHQTAVSKPADERHSTILADPLRRDRYGKWTTIAFDHLRLLHESNVGRSSGRASLKPKAIDHPSNVNDIGLWNCILDFRYRRDGLEGVAAVMQGLQERKALWAVQGPSTEHFWATVLTEAVQDEALLQSVWEYAEWMVEAHGVRWPKLYETVLSAMISRKEAKRACHWHIRLSPSYGLEAPAFTALMKRFIRDPDPIVQEILWDIYLTSHHHQLYDTLLPYLYAEGQLSIARSWRQRFALVNDAPATLAARPFLRFLTGYFPRDSMAHNERLLAGVDPEPEPGKGSGVKELLNHVVEDATDHSKASKVMGYRQLINRIHGQTFGIKEKRYNDSLGARWFASSWISLDLAVEVVRFMGWYRIGPLSLQSIALREGQPDRILDRLDQLELLGIDIGDSSYAKAIRHLATMDDHETLADLLNSDLHPDVFDDASMQKQMLGFALKSGDWKQYRLIMAVKVAVSLDAVSLASNRIVAESLVSNNKRVTLRILEDMHMRGVQLLPSTSDAISMHIINNFAPHKNYRPNTGYNLALCRLVMSSRFPLATQAVQTILYHVGNAGRFEELEKLSLEILRQYNDVRSSTRPTLNVHKLDVPEFFREEPSYGSFQLIPRELNLRHELHPVQRIFDLKLMQHIIQWGFSQLHQHQPSTKPQRQPVDFSFTRAVKLLAVLRDNGVVFDFKLLKKIRQLIEMHLVTLLADSPGWRPTEVPPWMAQLSVEQAKALCDDAWGAELLPPADVLKERVNEVSKNNHALWEGGRMRTQLDPNIKRTYSFRQKSPHFMLDKETREAHKKKASGQSLKTDDKYNT